MDGETIKYFWLYVGLAGAFLMLIAVMIFRACRPKKDDDNAEGTEREDPLDTYTRNINNL